MLAFLAFVAFVAKITWVVICNWLHCIIDGRHGISKQMSLQKSNFGHNNGGKRDCVQELRRSVWV